MIINNLIKLIISVGMGGECKLKELKLFLPNYPDIRGSEDIFKICHANARKYIDKNVEFLIKGLHLIELKYRNLTGNDFGFGSPSPTSKVIEALRQINPEEAQKLTEWVSFNGGNYYILKQ
jgi:hypothetical protein